jgi:alanine racemase
VSAPVSSRPAWAEVDLDAVRHNTAALARVASPARLCAVVKADAYGHGAAPVAKASLEAGASALAVAFVEEGAELRAAGVTAPVLVLSEPEEGAMARAAEEDLSPTLYTTRGLRAAAAAARRAGSPLGVHVKVDTGMHRVGADPEEALSVACGVQEAPELRLDGLWTHLAVAEEEGDGFTARQLEAFGDVVGKLRAGGVEAPTLHAANSAGAISHPASRLGMVRCGIAIYGYAPSTAVGSDLAAAGETLLPVMSLRARVSHVRRLAAGERISYGRRYELRRPSFVATVPVGYADGVPRRLFEAGGEVLIGGERRPIAGTVTMDQLMADCGDDEVSPGDEVVLIGSQGSEAIGADEWAQRLGTISYEVLCGIGPRVPRLARAGSVEGHRHRGRGDGQG